MVTFKVVKIARGADGTFRIWFVVEGEGTNHHGLLAHFKKHVAYFYHSDYRADLLCTIHSIGNRPAGDELDAFKQFVEGCNVCGIDGVTLGGLYEDCDA